MSKVIQHDVLRGGGPHMCLWNWLVARQQWTWFFESQSGGTRLLQFSCPWQGELPRVQEKDFHMFTCWKSFQSTPLISLWSTLPRNLQVILWEAALATLFVELMPNFMCYMAFMKEKLVNLCSLIGLRLALSPPNQYSCCNFSFIYWYFVIFLPILIHRKELQLFPPTVNLVLSVIVWKWVTALTISLCSCKKGNNPWWQL